MCILPSWLGNKFLRQDLALDTWQQASCKGKAVGDPVYNQFVDWDTPFPILPWEVHTTWINVSNH